jgi:methionine sulfoxide reductase heme-binding subunit
MAQGQERAAVARGTPDAWLKPGVLLGALFPLLAIGVRAARGTLGANPIAEVLNQLGLLALIFLIASLAATPIKLSFGYTWPLRIRRLLGLLAFFYASLHLLTYALLDRAGELGTLLEDLGKRPFITVGFLAWLLLVPLAITSTRAMIKTLGFARWKRLHQLSYLAGILGIVHFLWRVKKDASEPLTYGAILALLLGLRVYAWWQQRERARYR